MIQTVRDAEVKIGLLEREITKFRHEFRQFKIDHDRLTATNGHSQPTEAKSSEINDWIVSADGSQISHRLFHIFDKIRVRILEVVDLIVETLTAKTVNTDKLNITTPGTGRPFEITNVSDTLIIKDFSGANVVTFSDGTNRATFGYSILPTVLGINIGDSASGTKFWEINGEHVFVTNFYNSGVMRIKDGGGVDHDGMTLTFRTVKEISYTTATLNYKDHAGNNQSTPIVTGISHVPNGDVNVLHGLLVY